MKLSVRLVLLVSCGLLGSLLIGGFSVYSIHTTMVTERRAQIDTLLGVSKTLVEHFYALEKSGKLGREEAKSQAGAALSALHKGEDYIFAREDGANGEENLVAHPDPRRISSKIKDPKLPDGRNIGQAYREALSKADPAFVQIQIARPGQNVDALVPKLVGVSRFNPWGWTIGTGFFLDDIDDAFRRHVIELIILGVVLLGVIGGFTIFITRRIYAQLGGEPGVAMQAMNVIANGQLDCRLPVAPADSLMNALAMMQQKLGKIVSNIRQGADDLDGSARTIGHSMAEIHQASWGAKEATAAMAATIEEMTVSVGLIADSAREAETISERAASKAETGESSALSATAAIEDVAATIVTASRRISSLAQRSREIDDVTKIIQDIAKQTNMLALNAAIEAARAGEQGRGFAVVADEVRVLAGHTAQATSRIAQTIEAIQMDTDAVVSCMSSVDSLVACGVEQAKATAGMLREIRSGVEAAQEKVREMAYATTEQHSASMSMANGIEHISQAAEHSTESVVNVKSTVDGQMMLSKNLRYSIAQFKV